MPDLAPAIFLDRDGVIIENRPNYVRTVADARFLPGALEATVRLTQREWRIVIVTNQSPIGRGWVRREAVEAINDHVRQTILAAGGRIDGIYLCPHRPDENCACRKPAPGLLLQAARDLHIDLPASIMIGDAVSDVQAARAVGATPIFVLSGLGNHQELEAAGLGATLTLPDFASAVEHIIFSLWPGQPLA